MRTSNLRGKYQRLASKSEARDRLSGSGHRTIARDQHRDRREIEDFLFTHPQVAAVAVFGVPDEYYGEEIMAWVQLHEGGQVSEQELREFCKGNIAHFKLPKYIWFVDEFPMTVTGKLQKFRMREMAVERLAGERAPSSA